MSVLVYSGFGKSDKAARAAIAALLAEFVPVIPGWVQRLYVRYDAASKDADPASVTFADTQTDNPYRYAILGVRPIFFQQKRADQRVMLAHEFGHILAAPFVELVDSIMEQVGEDGPWIAALRKQLERSEEAVVQDFGYGLVQALDRSRKMNRRKK